MINKDIFTESAWKRISDKITAHPKEIPVPISLSPKLRDYIWNRDKGFCVYCKKTATDCEHVIPRSHGGPNIKENIVLSCHSCNCLKGSSFNIDYLAIALNHLLFVGENIDWIENIFLKEDEDIIEIRGEKIIYEKSFCLRCNKRCGDEEDFCSDKCESKYYGYESECIWCNEIHIIKESKADNDEDFCSTECESDFYLEFED